MRRRGSTMLGKNDLWRPDVDVTALGGDRLGASAVALGDTGVGTLVAARPDCVGISSLDRLMKHYPH